LTETISYVRPFRKLPERVGEKCHWHNRRNCGKDVQQLWFYINSCGTKKRTVRSLRGGKIESRRTTPLWNETTHLQNPEEVSKAA